MAKRPKEQWFVQPKIGEELSTSAGRKPNPLGTYEKDSRSVELVPGC
jgi:hypothetical protein